MNARPMNPETLVELYRRMVMIRRMDERLVAAGQLLAVMAEDL